MSQENLDTSPEERREIINKISKTSSPNYCTIRMILGKKKTPTCNCPYENGCKGNRSCPNKDALYESNIPVYIIDQDVVVEKVRFLDGVQGKPDETWNDAAFHWTDKQNGGAATFSYAFRFLGIHDPETLERLCVHSMMDAKPILERVVA